MQRQFVVNFALLLGLNLLVKPFYVFGIEAEVQNRVGAETFGNYFALISFSFLLNILLDLGMANYNARRVAQLDQDRPLGFGPMLGLRLTLMALYLVVLLASGALLSYTPEQLVVLALLGCNQALAALVLFLRSNLGGLHLFRQDSVISVLDRLVLIAVCSLLLWGGVTDQPFQVEWLVYAQTFSYALAAVVALAMLGKHVRPVRLKFDRAYARNLLRQSAPFALLIFLMSVYLRTDTVMLERLHPEGPEQAGIYAMAFRFFEAGNMLAYLFAILLLPMFSRMLHRSQPVYPVLEQAFRLLYPGAVLAAVMCVCYRQEFMDWRYIEHTQEAAGVFGWLMAGFAGFAMNYLFGSLLTAGGRLKALNLLAAAAVVGNIVANALLIPTYGAWGAAVASCATHGLMAVGQIALAVRMYGWRPGAALVAKAVAFAGLCITAGWASTILPGPWLLKCGALLLAGGAVAFSLGYLRPSRLIALVKSSRKDTSQA